MRRIDSKPLRFWRPHCPCGIATAYDGYRKRHPRAFWQDIAHPAKIFGKLLKTAVAGSDDEGDLTWLGDHHVSKTN